jgi:hypothetical protein
MKTIKITVKLLQHLGYKKKENPGIAKILFFLFLINCQSREKPHSGKTKESFIRKNILLRI